MSDFMMDALGSKRNSLSKSESFASYREGEGRAYYY